MKELVLVSGSGRGLGSSVAKAFASNGYKVAINYFKSQEKAYKLADELGSDTKAFFASHQARSITDQNLTVDGGLTLN